ncbi:MAG: phosphatidate cytidylyltransferase [Acidiferrobacter sp.]
MLKTRLLTAFLAGPLILVGLFLLSATGVAVLLGVFTLVAAFEWASLSEVGVTASVLFVLTVGALEVASLWVPIGVIVIVALVWWLWAIFEVFGFRDKRGPLWRYGAARLFCGVLVLVPAWRGCVALKEQDVAHPWLLIWVLLMVWTADSLAYFAGRAFGRHKLAPLVSPGKTIEGVVGGLAGAALVGGLGAYMLGLRVGSVIGGVVGGIVLGILVAVFSVVGDLLESKAKRLAGVKDSGRWLPGHGGILDRIDALTAAVPLFLLGVRWLGVR